MHFELFCRSGHAVHPQVVAKAVAVKTVAQVPIATLAHQPVALSLGHGLSYH